MSKSQNTKSQAKTEAVLSPTQRDILEHALDNTEGRIEWFPPNIKGGARAKILESLKSRSLVSQRGQHWRATKAAHAALGRDPADPASAPASQPASAPAPVLRASSKQAKVLEMLKRNEGATIQQLMDATQWQSHTVRGMISGVLRKKLKLTVQGEKAADGGATVYRIV